MPKKNKNDILEQELGVITKEKPEVKKPNMYAVVLINDDYTPMEFVIYILQTIFKKSYEEAKIQFTTHIENSTRTSNIMVDFFHYHNKEQTLKKSIKGVANSAYTTLESGFNKFSKFLLEN